MCYKTIDQYSCGDKEEATIPCEAFIDNGTCTQHEQAKQDKVTDHEGKCPECQHFDNEMKRLTEDPDLCKPVEKSAPEQYDGPRLYFKECTKWGRCGRKLHTFGEHDLQNVPLHLLTIAAIDISHPKETNIEREPQDPEFIDNLVEHTPCSKCALAPASVIEDMKRKGIYDTPDPWGAMNEEPVAAAGSSSEGASSVPAWGAAATSAPEPKAPEHKLLSLDEIEDMDDDDMYGASPQDKARHAGVAAGAPTSFGQSRSPSPTPNKKGKGRVGEPEGTYASRYGAAADSEDEPEISGDEDKAPRGRPAGQTHSRDSSMDANVHDKRDRSFSPGEEALAKTPAPPTDRAADAPAEFIEISDAERAQWQPPVGMKFTAERWARFKTMKGLAEQESIRRKNKGLDDEE